MSYLTLKDLNAINILAQKTWGWGIKYSGERGNDGSGKYTILAVDPREVLWHSTDGKTVEEAVCKFLIWLAESEK